MFNWVPLGCWGREIPNVVLRYSEQFFLDVWCLENGTLHIAQFLLLGAHAQSVFHFPLILKMDDVKALVECKLAKKTSQKCLGVDSEAYPETPGVMFFGRAVK